MRWRDQILVPTQNALSTVVDKAVGGKGGSWVEAAKAKAFRRPNLKSDFFSTFFFQKFTYVEIIPCFFTFFKNLGSISPRNEIIVSTS